MDNKDFGDVIVGAGTPQERQLRIIDYVQAAFFDHRLVNICGIEDGSFLISVENPESTGRSNQKMWVGRESLLSIFATMGLYLNCKGIDIEKESKAITENKEIRYSISDNLKPFDLESRQEINNNK